MIHRVRQEAGGLRRDVAGHRHCEIATATEVLQTVHVKDEKYGIHYWLKLYFVYTDHCVQDSIENYKPTIISLMTSHLM